MKSESEETVVVGGDFNSPLNIYDPTVLAMKWNSFKDTHSHLGYLNRKTAPLDTLAKYGLWTFDYIF